MLRIHLSVYILPNVCQYTRGLESILPLIGYITSYRNLNITEEPHTLIILLLLAL